MMTQPYNEFLLEKQIIHKSTGIEVSEDDISPVLYPHQNALTRYYLRKGHAAILADTGLGKTLMELEAAKHITEYTNSPVLICMPLWVAYQTIDMAKNLFNRNIKFASDKTDIAPGQGVYVTNYEKLAKFKDIEWGGMLFDESSVFKGDGKFFNVAKRISKNIQFVMCASATPSPNSIDEMGRQSEVLDILTVDEMQSNFFVNRQDKKKLDRTKVLKNKLSNGDLVLSEVPFTQIVNGTVNNNTKQRQRWELKPYADQSDGMNFYEWLASWAMAVKHPSDIGFSDEGYNLPNLTITPIFIEADYVPDDQLVFTGLGGVGDRSKVRKLTLEHKCQMALEIIGDDTDQWAVWCGLNDESDRMAELLGDRAVNVQGKDKTEKKVEDLKAFVNGEIQILVSKIKICGHGSNFQNCHKAIFVGLSDSWEAFYQAIKRFHRFGQTEDVEIYVILAEEEREIWDNVQYKGKEAEYMTQKLVKNAAQYQKAEIDGEASKKMPYVTDEIKTDKYHIMLGDSCERLKEIETSSVGLSVYSPPFGDLFVYSNTPRDLGNSSSQVEFLEHYAYIVDELLRVTMPGRSTVVHVADIHYKKSKHGRLGVMDFAGDVIRLYEQRGWYHWGRIPIAKNPQQAASRLKVEELKFQTLGRDAARLMPIQPDYLLVFRKPGKNPIPILPKTRDEMDNNLWIEWAGLTWVKADFESLGDIQTEEDFLEYAKMIWRERNAAIWYDIKEGEVLQHKGKKGARLNENDTRHICPLQLEPVERAIKMWSNPGDIVLSPFMGIGTEVYQAVMFGRYGIGIELKPEYYYKAHENVQKAVRLSQQEDLFSMAGIEV